MRWPSIKDVAAELRRVNAYDAGDGSAIDPDTGEPFTIDVRLQVLPNGSWQVWWGDSQYDTDHRGFWGASSVPGNGRRFMSADVAKDLIDQAKELKATVGDDGDADGELSGAPVPSGQCVSEAASRAYTALQHAAEQIGRRAHASGEYRGRRGRGYSIRPEHAELVKAMSDVCGGRISPEEAMGLLHTYDVDKARFGGAFDEDEPDPDEPQPEPEDYTITDSPRSPHGVAVAQVEGDFLGEFPDQREAKKFIARRMEEHKVWTNVWFVSDHGNFHLIEMPYADKRGRLRRRGGRFYGVSGGVAMGSHARPAGSRWWTWSAPDRNHPVRARDLDTFTAAYIEAALWSSYDAASDETLDRNFGPRDIAPATLRQMIKDAKAFQDQNDRYSAQDGHDFWLSRNGHGVGFFGRDDPDADKLKAAAKAFSTFDLYVGDDGKVHGSPLDSP